MQCFPDVLEKTYSEKLWLTFLREWVRATLDQAGLEDLDDKLRAGEPINVPDPVRDEIDLCIEAMAQGGSVVPGVWLTGKDTAPGSFEDVDCYQNWVDTACFARWYMRASPETKAKIRQLLAAGNPTPWVDIDGGESGVRLCTSEGDANCCVPEIWSDSAYLNMDRVEESRGLSTWGIVAASAALGLGAAFLKKIW